ncbi:MAG: RNA methyltransferase, partial [Alphaproteobacteria bacterium]
ERIGILFGPERAGLTNDDVALAEAIIEVPLNPAFASLNLAQAVLLVGYEWFQAARAPDLPPPAPSREGTRPATQAELLDLFEHLERELDACGFLRVREKRPGMVRNIRNIFTRAGLTDREVSTLRGIVTGLTRRKD